MNPTRYTLATLLLLVASTSAGQGTPEKYARAAGLENRFNGKTLNLTLQPHWAPDGNRFWFREEAPPDGYRFVVVDALTGKSAPAFDHADVANQLSQLEGDSFSADSLPIHQLVWGKAGESLLLLGLDGCWTLDPKIGKVQTAPDASARLTTTLNELRRPRPSRPGDTRTSVLFVNATDQTVHLYWLPHRHDRRDFSTIPPRGVRSISTYAGHVWLVCDEQGDTLNIFEVNDTGGIAIVNGVRPPSTKKPPFSGRGYTPDYFSPDGNWMAYFQDNNLFIHHVADGNGYPLSTDGTAENSYSGPVRWSPDSTHLVAMQTTAGGDRKVYYVESSPPDQLQPKLHSYDYLKPGDPIPQPRPRLFDVTARKQIPTDDGLAPNPWSNTEVHWQPDSSAFSYLYNQRGHQVMRVIEVNAQTGDARTIVDEQPETLFCYSDKTFLRHLPESGELIWMSERSGWNHLYLYDTATGEVTNPITAGPWVVRGVENVDPEKREILFRCGGAIPEQDPYHVHYARVGLDGSRLTFLTEGAGTHKIAFSPDHRFYIDTWSRVDQPPVHELRRTSDGVLICEVLRADHSALVNAGWKTPERFVAKGRDGQTDVYGIIIRPTDFDPTKRYPVVENIYAGPQAAFVPKAFFEYSSMQSIAELGFIVVQIDGMGTNFRSKAFHDVCWKNLGDAGLPDRIAWIKAAAAEYPEMDTDRVGIYGGSAGGQSALRALLMYPDFYKVGVADCGCHDNRVDKIWWNEQWMGWPIGPHYEEQSNVTQAHRLQGKLLLIVGEKDENVDPASTMQVVDALVKADRDFDMLVLPGVGHGAAETPYGSRRRADFLVRHLLSNE